MIRKTLFVATATLAACGTADAAGIGVRAGTLGLGGDVAWSIAPTLSARIGYSALQTDHDVNTSGVRYDGSLKAANLAGLLDFSPLGPFRITGGVIYNRNRYEMTGAPDGATWRVGNNTYAAADIGRLSGNVRSGRSFAPYLGIGYGNVSGLGVNFYADLGILFQGSPRARLSADCGPALGAGGCSALQADVVAEERRLEEKLKNFRYLPVLSIGLTVGF